ncbi:hypothetical protein [Hydrogenophaga sp.]|uniref:hypothetical protein n=1 Tax=Hydrogenophaga sp. TaxID=1904254 RepID=UPI002FCB03B1
MTSLHYALTLGLFATLLFWLGWRERAHDNPRDGGLLYFFGGVTGLLALVVPLLE